MTQGLREKNKNARYQSIVSTAEQLFLERGLDSVQMQDIADAEKIGIATLFRYFSRKDSLIVAVAIQNLERTIPVFQQIALSPKSAYERLEDTLNYVLANQTQSRSNSTKFREAFESYASFSKEPLPNIQDYIDTQKQVSLMLGPIIEDGQRDGSLRQDISIKESIMTIINAYGIFGNNIVLKSEITYLEEIQPEIQQKLLKEMLLSYVRAK
ncbi:TetR/AcrR family transcriptional regulator [Paenibacillus endoradicis]|uniref:TetR/AcrR family transcriptional regulator n=1 Tax=Paenibacillus endoradicis TaxID=2972487 RepID=UPI00215983E7|nr:TetR/AcrR family transcriptional regulator [Paenibacillus endoradicis]MCR8656987.1 TetR/AcrR family transcriptional regulator [Paenibacillus endoradicis]